MKNIYKAWSKRDLQILIEQYPVIGKKVQLLLDDERSVQSIQNKASQLKIRSCVNPVYGKKWTEEEERILMRQYPVYGTKILEFKNKTMNQIKDKAKRMGIKYGGGNKWAYEEDQIILKRYHYEGTQILSELNNKSYNMLLRRAKKLGVKHFKNRPWSYKEVEILRSKYPDVGTAIMPLLNSRTKKQIQTKAMELGIGLKNKSVWSEEQIKYLIDNYEKLGSKCQIGGKSEVQIWKKASQLGLKSKVDRHVSYIQVEWTPSEISTLKEKYPEMGMRVGLLLPNKTSIQIRSKKQYLNLYIDKTKFKQRKFFMEADKCQSHFYMQIGTVARKDKESGFYRQFDVFECQYCGIKSENPRWIEHHVYRF